MTITITDIGSGMARIILNHKLVKFMGGDPVNGKWLDVQKATLLGWMNSIAKYVNNELNEECLFEVE